MLVLFYFSLMVIIFPFLFFFIVRYLYRVTSPVIPLKFFQFVLELLAVSGSLHILWQLVPVLNSPDSKRVLPGICPCEL